MCVCVCVCVHMCVHVVSQRTTMLYVNVVVTNTVGCYQTVEHLMYKSKYSHTTQIAVYKYDGTTIMLHTNCSLFYDICQRSLSV